MLDAVAVVGLVSGVATLADAIIEVFKCLSQYWRDIESAPRRSEELRREIDTLFSLIPKLRDAFDADVDDITKEHLKSEVDDLVAMLQKLLERIKPNKVKGIRRLKWPFKEAENSRYISKIERFKSTFSMLMTVGQRYKLRGLLAEYPSHSICNFANDWRANRDSAERNFLFS